MLQKFLSLFQQKNKQISVTDLKIGDIIELSYHHPKNLGFFSDNQLICTRLNPDEIDNRTIKGIVTNVFRNADLLKWFLEVKTQKILNGRSVERKFLLLENEIERIRKLT